MPAGRRPDARTPTAIVRVTLDNVRLYGRHAPWWGARLMIEPRELKTYAPQWARGTSGRVLHGDWDLRARPIMDHPKVSAAVRHWRDGLSWEESGAHRFMLEAIEREGSHDGCITLEDVVARFEQTDRMFAEVASERRLRKSRVPFLEPDGVLVHIGRSGRPIFGGSGCHRLAAALVVGVPSIPAKLGGVHPLAVTQWGDLRAHSRP